MKNVILIALAIICFQSGFSQYPENSTPPYKKNPYIPVFDLQRSNKTVFSSTKIKKNVPVIIMFFSPACDHCMRQFEDMRKRIKDLAKYQIIMATYQPIEELSVFDISYELSKYPNIITGRDIKYVLPPFYHIQNFPFLAFYGKDGKIKSAFEGNMSVNDMIKRLQ